MVLCGDFVNGGYIFPLAMFPTLMKCATLDGPFVWMLISDTRAMGRFLDVVRVVFALRVSLGWAHT